MTDREDVVLFTKYAFHKSCLKPVSERLNEMGIPHIYTGKRHQVYDLFNERKKKFKVFVLADEWGNLFRDCSETLITTGHSMVSKNTTFDSKNSEMDYICVPSQHYKNIFLERGIRPRKDFWVTGYPAAEKIFRERDQKKYQDRHLHILIAPTYNKDLSLMETLIKAEAEENFMESLFSKLSIHFENFHFLFKLHPVLEKKYPHQFNFVKALQKEWSEHVLMADDSHDDISEFILWSDIVIGDCSGAIFLGAAANRPILAFNNPEREKSPYYDPMGVEWVCRADYCSAFSIMSSTLIYDEIKMNFMIDPKSRRRENFVDLVFGEDEIRKNASENIAKNIQAILGGA